LRPLERIGDFDVHPVASIFPMMSAKEEQDLCMSIADLGLQEPVVIHEGLLVDGRNRLKACISTGVPVRTVEWAKVAAHHHLRTGKGGLEDFPATTVDQWIMARNIARRSITEDQRTTLWVQYNLWQAEEEAKEAKVSATFKPGNEGGQGGDRRSDKAKSTVDTISYPPLKERDTAEKNARSTVGKVAASAGVSHHKAAQAIKLVKAVESGASPKEDLELVKAGAKKLSDAVRPLRPEKPEPTLEETVRADLRRLMDKHAVANHEHVKQIIKEVLWGK